MNRLPVWISLWLLLTVSSIPGWVGAEPVVDLDAPVATGSDITYKKLVDSVFKGVKEDSESNGRLTASEKVLRRPGTKDRTVLPEGTRLDSFEAIRVRGDGRRYIVMFWNAVSDATDVPGGGAAILAVFPEGSAEPQDVADVKGDVFCSLGGGQLLPIGPDDGFTIANSHHNSNQGYLNTTLFHIHEGRLRRVSEVFTLRLNVACEKSFDQKLAWRTEPDGDKPYPKVVAEVTLTMGIGKEEGGDCPKGKQGFRKQVFSQIYCWDKAKNLYVAEGKGFEALDRLNKKSL